MLTTVARLKTFLDISDSTYDAVLEIIINSCTDFIENYCDRRFKKATYNEIYDGTGTRFLFLKQYPVSSTDPFTLQVRNGNSFTNIPTEDYFVKYNEGIIVGEFHKLPRHYRVSYSAGYDYDNITTYLSDVGCADLELACWKLCGKIFNRRKGNSDITSESIGNYSVSFMRETMLDPQIKSILDRYKKPENYGY